ncbi:MAG: hypothetical protein ACRD0P_26315, partial [Stackebrandtia sp.]
FEDSMKGQFAFGAKATDFGVEAVSSTFGAPKVDKGKEGMMDKMSELPASDIAGAVALPKDLSDSLGMAAATGMMGGAMAGNEDPSGEMKEVLDALSGASGTFSVSDIPTGMDDVDPQAKVELETTSPENAETLKGMVSQTGGGFDVSTDGATITGQTPGFAGDGKVSDNKYYSDAVGGAPDAINYAVFADVTKLMDENDKKDFGALKAVGFTTGTKDGESVGNYRLVIE